MATVDSGSTECVTNEEEAGGIPTEPSPQSEAGIVYEVANSATVPNEGQKKCEVLARGMHWPKKMNLAVAKVHKTLLSVGRMTRAGHTIVFSDVHGNYIENNFTGERTPMRKVGHLYEVDLWIRSPQTPFVRPG